MKLRGIEDFMCDILITENIMVLLIHDIHN